MQVSMFISVTYNLLLSNHALKQKRGRAFCCDRLLSDTLGQQKVCVIRDRPGNQGLYESLFTIYSQYYDIKNSFSGITNLIFDLKNDVF